MESLLTNVRQANGNGRRGNNSRQNTWSSEVNESSSPRLSYREEKAIEGVLFIADHLQEEHEEKQVNRTSLRILGCSYIIVVS